MVTKKTAKASSYNAPLDKCFWTSDGKALKNLKELVDALEQMNDNVFKHHVNGKKNDFSAWVKDVFGETKLSGSIAKNKTAASMAKKIKSVI